MGPRVGVATTVKHTGRTIESFVDYHKKIGFERFYVFFDDPNDPAQEYVRQTPEVRIIPVTKELLARHAERPAFTKKWYDVEVMARQEFHADIATDWAVDELDWLFHFDSDEAFWCEGRDVRAILRRIPAKFEQVLFMNHEGASDALEIADPFREVTSFKRNPLVLRAEGRTDVPGIGDPARYFVGYSNGKTAARIRPGIKPRGCHEFVEADGQPLPTMIHDESALLLHYHNCGFSRFVRKYRNLGNFSDLYFDAHPIPLVSHLASRDACGDGDQALLRVYRERYQFPVDRLRDLEAKGYMRRIDGVASTLHEVPR